MWKQLLFKLFDAERKPAHLQSGSIITVHRAVAFFGRVKNGLREEQSGGRGFGIDNRAFEVNT